MIIDSLSLRNFRNIQDLRLEFSPAANLFVGRNAQGKTNIIEAIALISTGQSFRAQEYRDMIMSGKDCAEADAGVTSLRGTDRIQVEMDPSKKIFLKNEKRARARVSSRLCTVLFAPEEIMLLRSSPGARRKYIDALICQAFEPHGGLVSKYEKVMRHRNRILQDQDLSSHAKISNLRPWDEQLVDLGSRIVTGRLNWCERLNELIPDNYREMAPQDGPARFVYLPHCGVEAAEKGTDGVVERLVEQIESRRQDELTRGVSLVGPHRDDLVASIGGSWVKNFGSQGQHRSFVLALKLSERGLLRSVTGEEPILLLDDVASELDSERNGLFFRGLAETKGQVFITATRETEIAGQPGGSARIFDVCAGSAIARKQR